MSLELTILGCSGSGPAPGAPASGYLLRSETTSVWMDAGTGTFMALAEIMDPAALDAVVISHFHADHCADFFGFFHYVAYRGLTAPQIPVFVPTGGKAKIGGFLDAADDHPVWRVLDVDEVEDGGVRHVGEMTLLFAAAAHSVPTNAVRIESGRSSLAFSADTGLGGGFPWLASKADVALVEAALGGAAGRSELPVPPVRGRGRGDCEGGGCGTADPDTPGAYAARIGDLAGRGRRRLVDQPRLRSPG